MAIDQTSLTNIIKQAFPEAEVVIKSLVNDEDHYMLEISSKLFSGKSRVEQHKMVNNALDGVLGGQLHALSIKTIAI